jgi:Rod binding domain-containing protein
MSPLKPIDIPVRHLSREETARALEQSGATLRSADDPELKARFQEFTAGTFVQTMLKSLRSTTGKTPYMHGGYAEEVFRGQLDQTLSESLAKSHGGLFSDSLYEQYMHRQPGISPAAAQAEEAGHGIDVVI